MSDTLQERGESGGSAATKTASPRPVVSPGSSLPENNVRPRTRRWLAILALVASDVVFGVLFWGAAYYASVLAGAEPFPTTIAIVVTATNTSIWVGLRALLGLYPGYGFSQAEELRRQTLSTVGAFLFTLTVIYSLMIVDFSVGVEMPLLLPLLAASLNAFERLFLGPIGRYLVKLALAKAGLWGKSVVILGAGETGCQMVRILKDEWSLGFKPVGVFDFRLTAEGNLAQDVPYGGTVTDALALAHKKGIDTAIFAMPHVRRKYVSRFVDKASDHFRHVVVVPNVAGAIATAVRARDLGPTFGLEIKQNLLTPWGRVGKRSLDIFGVIVGGALISPVLLAIALLIRIDSPGPLFYKQMRVGTGGKHFCCWKFRTMHTDAQRLLTELLQREPQLREEWERDHKLRDDPRITRVGRYLRRLSLDELPQLWNVWCGQMSLVGPRPITDDEIGRYQDAYDLYRRVSPGMSGLWQVSGRSETSYEERVDLDTYYVRNWSVWIDVVILARTIGAVIFSRGAV